MGCKCCKMIRSYIFDPEEIQSPGCIHEVSINKYNEQGSNKSKSKENSEIQEHKNELQKDELNRTENKSQVNSTTETLWNHRSNDLHEDGLGKSVAKLGVAVNGGNSCAGVYSTLNPNTDPVKEASEQGISRQSETSSASNRDFCNRSYRSGQELDLEAVSQRKSVHNEPNSIPDVESQSAEDRTFPKETALLETQNNIIQLPDIDYPQNGNQTRNYIGKDCFSINCAHSDQNTGPSAIQDQDLCVTLPLPMKESGIEPFKTESASLNEGITSDITAVAVTKVAEVLTHSNHKDINGEIEEEDAEVAEALAALEAATAGEDLEDDDED